MSAVTGAAGTLLLFDDRRVIHESTRIQPLARAGHRDTPGAHIARLRVSGRRAFA
jgi:hypothetical protein